MFTHGFTKIANFMNVASRVGRSALKYAKNPTVLRNAAAGAGAGAIGGAMGAEEGHGFSGALKGAAGGALAGGVGTAGMKAWSANKRLGGFRNARMNSFYGGHGQGD